MTALQADGNKESPGSLEAGGRIQDPSLYNSPITNQLVTLGV